MRAVSFTLADEKQRPTAFSRSCRTLAVRWRAIGLAILVVVLVAAAAKLVLGGGAVPVFVALLRSVQDLGVWGLPLLFAVESAAFLLLVPISPLHVGLGFLYGPLEGTLLAWAAYAIGCVPPFLLARIPMLAERFVQIRKRTEVLDGVFAAVELEPFKLIVCLRLSPLLPSTLNSYLLGLTNVPLRIYIGASLVGSLPNVGAYVYLGTLLTSLADIGAGRAKQTPLTWAMLITGGMATVGGIVYVSRIATRRIHSARARLIPGGGGPIGDGQMKEAEMGSEMVEVDPGLRWRPGPGPGVPEEISSTLSGGSADKEGMV